MKSYLKKIFSTVFSLSILCVFGICSAQNNINQSYITKVSEDINKLEEIKVEEVILPKSLNKCNFNYKKVSKIISYINKQTNDILATASAYLNFRYNPSTKESVCLSTNSSKYGHNNSYELDVSSRCCNKTKEIGSGLASVSFNDVSSYFGFKKQSIENQSCEINCDPLGNISVENLEN